MRVTPLVTASLVASAATNGIDMAEDEPEFPQVIEGSIWERRDTKLEVKVTKVEPDVSWEGGGMTGSCSAFYWHHRFKFVRY